MSPVLAELVAAALLAAARTDGNVDPTLGAALDAAGYDRDISLLGGGLPRTFLAAPEPAWRQVCLDNNILTEPAGTRLDLGAIAKAWAADRSAAAARAGGTGVLVDVDSYRALTQPARASSAEQGRSAMTVGCSRAPVGRGRPGGVGMTTIGGLPAHILLVHAVVVLVPLSALLIVLVSVWPAARVRLALSTAIVAVVALISVPLTTDAGEWLERRVQRTELVRTHTELGDTMLPWAIGLAVVALAVLARQWQSARTRPAVSVQVGGSPGAAHTDSASQAWGGRGVSIALAVVALVVAVGSVVTVYEIGDSGARAAWQGQFSQQAQSPPPGPPSGG